MESLALETESHLHPDKLQGALQAMIKDLTDGAKTIITWAWV